MFLLCKLSLANRSIVALLTLGILLFGAFVIPSLKEELLPDLAYPAVSVITAYPGASPALVEQEVTTPLEQSFQGLPGLQKITSYSNQGYSIIVVAYTYGVNLNEAQQTLTRRISLAQNTLPAEATPQIQSYNVSDQPIIRLAITSAARQQDLALHIKQDVVPVLQGLPGVGNVTVTGVREPLVSITLNLQKLQNNGLSVSQVQNILEANNLSIPAGEVSEGKHSAAIRVGNTFSSLQEIKDIIVGVRAAGAPTQSPLPTATAQPPTQGTATANSVYAPIKLSDVASVQQILAPSTSFTRTNGRPSLGISLTKTAEANTVALSQAVKAHIAELEQRLGQQAHISVITDQAPSIQSAIENLFHEGLLGAGFAILVILVFLFSLRSTLVTAISIPLSLVIALIALWAGNYSLNILTLGGLTIAVGRVVDDSIVVLENIYRHLRNGMEKQVAVLNGVREVAGAVTASTLTTVAVFLPIAFTSGIVGEFFRPFSFTVTMALLASLFVSLTIIPVLAYWFLYTPGPLELTQHLHDEKTSLLEQGYTPILHWVIQHRIVTLLCALLLLLGSLSLYPLLPTNLFSNASQNSFSFSQQMPAGTSLAEANRAALQVEAILAAIPEIKSYQVTVGSSAGSSNGSSGLNGANFAITTSSGIGQEELQQRLRLRLRALKDVGSITLVAGQQNSNSTLTIDVQANEEQILEQATLQVEQAVLHLPNVSDVASNLNGAVPLIDVKIEPQKALQFGLTTAQVSQNLRLIYTGTTVTRVLFNGVQQDVILKLDAQANTVQKIRDLQLPAPQGNVRLGDLATVKSVTGPTQITHIATRRSATITAQIAGQDIGAVSTELQKRIDTLRLPIGAHVTIGGITQEQNEAFRSLGLALLAAILLVYLVMVATFRSLLQPIILLISIPFAGTGSILLLLATHTALGAPALIGALMLIGIVVTNAIVLLDLIHQYRLQGSDARTAVMKGGTQRLRPILMTAIGTILALLPMALGLNGSSGFISGPLAIVVIGGLSTSTMLTLLLVPTLYVTLEDMRERFRRKTRRDFVRGQHLKGVSRSQKEQQLV